MPIQYKYPGYLGNGVLFFLAFVMIFTGSPILGILLAALSGLNLYLIYKLDRFSDPEVTLARELEMAKMHEELLAAQKRIEDMEAAAAPLKPAPPQISPPS